MSKKIEFIPQSKIAGITNFEPQPAIKNLPHWYKEIPQFIDNQKKFKFTLGGSNGTIKRCIPFLDSLTAGYFIFLENDLWVEKNENNDTTIQWQQGDSDQVSTHSIQQLSQDQLTSEFDPQPFKFKNNWGIKTPTGYSSLLLHPLNQDNLPFRTMAGIVDTDSYNVPVNFPFLIKKDFEGIIEAGTPIAQVIPFKRESWEMEISKYDENIVTTNNAKFFSKIYRGYKQMHWARKDFR